MANHAPSVWNLLGAFQRKAKVLRRSSSRPSRSLRFEGLEGRELFAVWADPYFGNSGKVTTVMGFGDQINASLIQSDGKIVVTGSTSYYHSSDFAPAGYNPDGNLDTSFDGDGKVITPVNDVGPPIFVSGIASLAVQGDGKIVAAGYAVQAEQDFALARYNSDGSLDTTFGEDGTVTTSISGGDDRISSVAIQSNGKIVVAGQSYSIKEEQEVFTLARYNSDGTLDASFGGDGKVATPVGENDYATSMFLQSDGKIIVAGYSYSSKDDHNVFTLARYNSNGSLDTSFDTDGKLTTPIGSEDRPFSVALQPDGKIVAAGVSATGSTSVIALVRYNSNGSLDTSFDGDGKVTTAIGSAAEARSVVIDENGKILIAGSSKVVYGTDFALWRYNSNGSLDVSFDGDGKLTTPIASPRTGTVQELELANDHATSVAIQSDGRIVASGYTYNGATDVFALVRYIETKPALSSFVVPTHASLGRRVHLSGLATDLNQDSSPLTYQWTVIGPNGFHADLMGANASFVPTSAGTFAVSLVVSDAEGLSVTRAGSITVENDVPTITGFVVPPRANEGERVRLWGLATDPNQLSSSLTYSWTVTGPGGFQQVLPGRNPNFVAPDDGTFQATFTVTDNGGLIASLVDSILAANVGPKITKYVVPTTGQAGKALQLVALATDPAGTKDVLAYGWVITGPNGYRKSIVGATVNWTPPTKLGSYLVTLTVSDGDGGQAIRKSAVTIGV